jgi:hypothetical protein
VLHDTFDFEVSHPRCVYSTQNNKMY